MATAAAMHDQCNAVSTKIYCVLLPGRMGGQALRLAHGTVWPFESTDPRAGWAGGRCVAEAPAQFDHRWSAALGG